MRWLNALLNTFIVYTVYIDVYGLGNYFGNFALKRDLYFCLAPLCKPPLTAHAPSQTNKAFILVVLAGVLFFETTMGDEE